MKSKLQRLNNIIAKVLAHTAWYYFKAGMTQAEIAENLGLTAPG